MIINYNDKTDFFNTDYNDAAENIERKRLFNQVCKDIANYMQANENALDKGTIKHLANTFDHFRREIQRSDFIDLWQEEDNANIVYAQEVETKTDGDFAFIVAFVGKGLMGYEVNIYEF